MGLVVQVRRRIDLDGFAVIRDRSVILARLLVGPRTPPVGARCISTVELAVTEERRAPLNSTGVVATCVAVVDFISEGGAAAKSTTIQIQRLSMMRRSVRDAWPAYRMRLSRAMGTQRIEMTTRSAHHCYAGSSQTARTVDVQF